MTAKEITTPTKTTIETRWIDGEEQRVKVEHLPTVISERDVKFCAQTIGGGIMSSVVVMLEDDTTRWARRAPALPASGDFKPPEEL